MSCVLIGACAVQPPPPPPSDTGTVEFFYNLLSDDGVTVTAVDCATAGVDSLRFSVGQDSNRDGVLSAFEETDSTVDLCNQADQDANGAFAIDEIGYFGPNTIRVGTYDLFSVEILDAEQNPILWRAFEATDSASRFVFQQGIRVQPDVAHFVAFPGGEERMDLELQIFLPAPPPPPPLP